MDADWPKGTLKLKERRPLDGRPIGATSTRPPLFGQSVRESDCVFGCQRQISSRRAQLR